MFICTLNIRARFVWFFLNLICCFKGPTYLEVVNRRRMRPNEQLALQDISTPNLDTIINVLNKADEENSRRNDTLNDKIKNLLTLTVASIPIAIYFLGSFPHSMIGLVGLFFLVTTIILLLSYWGLTARTVVSLDKQWYQEKDDAQIKKQLIKDLAYANKENNHLTDFLADIFDGARKYFVISLFFLLTNLVIGHFLNSQKDELKFKNSVDYVLNKISEKNKEILQKSLQIPDLEHKQETNPEQSINSGESPPLSPSDINNTRTSFSSQLLALFNKQSAHIQTSLITFFGVLFTSVGALVGFIITLWQFKKKLRHDSDIKIMESHSNLQREIYLEAAESLANTLAVVAKLPFKDVHEIDPEISRLNLDAVINKINMVSSNKTIEALTGFSENYFQIILDNYLAALPQQTIKDRQKYLSTKIQESLDLMTRINTQIASVPYDERTSDFMRDRNQHFKEVKEAFDQAMSENSILLDESDKLTSSRLEKNIISMALMSENLLDANIAIRKELKLSFDEAEYRRRSKLLFENNQKRLREFIAKLNEYKHADDE